MTSMFILSIIFLNIGLIFQCPLTIHEIGKISHASQKPERSTLRQVWQIEAVTYTMYKTIQRDSVTLFPTITASVRGFISHQHMNIVVDLTRSEWTWVIEFVGIIYSSTPSSSSSSSSCFVSTSLVSENSCSRTYSRLLKPNLRTSFSLSS